MIDIDDATVEEVLEPAAARTVVRDAFIAAAKGLAHNPVRAVAVPPAGYFAAMPAYVDTGQARALGAKLVCAFPANASKGLPTHRATVVLFDADSGAPYAVVAGDAITLRRTAAASVVATTALAAHPGGVYALLGAGAQGLAHLEAFLAASLVTSVRLWSRTPDRALALAALAAERVSVVVAASPDEAVQGADVIVTATASPTPLFDAASVSRHAHVNAVGACVPSSRELPGALVADANFYVDSREGALRESGDLLLAMPEYGLTASHVRAELGAVLASGQAVPHDRPTVYESLGIGILDVACAAYVLREVMSDAARGA